MSSFEERYFDTVPGEYDFDNDVLDLDATRKMIEIIKSMPVHRENTDGQITHHEGWCEEESTFLDMDVNAVTGHGFHVFCGSENLMVESQEDIQKYKEVFTGHSSK